MCTSKKYLLIRNGLYLCRQLDVDAVHHRFVGQVPHPVVRVQVVQPDLSRCLLFLVRCEDVPFDFEIFNGRHEHVDFPLKAMEQQKILVCLRDYCVVVFVYFYWVG